MTCPYCAERYLRDDREEPAFYPYAEKTKFDCLREALFISFPLGFFSAIAVGAAGESALWSIVSGFVVMATVGIPLWRHQVAKLSRSRSLLRAEWEESDRRLRNYDYAIMLKKAGFRVPERYLTPPKDPRFEAATRFIEDYLRREREKQALK